MPCLLRGDELDRVAEISRVIHGNRGDHGDGSIRDVRRVPGAAHADLDHRHVNGRVGKHRERHGGQHLEEGQRRLPARVGQLHVRQHLGVSRDEPVLAERRPVHADPFPHGGQVRAGVPAGAQPARPEQGVDHARGRGLAVGSGDVDNGILALRRAEQVHERLDAVERGIDLPLDAAGPDRSLDVGEAARRLRGGHVGKAYLAPPHGRPATARPRGHARAPADRDRPTDRALAGRR